MDQRCENHARGMTVGRTASMHDCGAAPTASQNELEGKKKKEK